MVSPFGAPIKTMALQSQEGAALVEVQTSALFGDLKVLQKQMQEAVGQDATSIEELMQRVQVAHVYMTHTLAVSHIYESVRIKPQRTHVNKHHTNHGGGWLISKMFDYVVWW